MLYPGRDWSPKRTVQDALWYNVRTWQGCHLLSPFGVHREGADQYFINPQLLDGNEGAAKPRDLVQCEEVLTM